ncbi:MAG TPA: Gfo/Idh/MocA family oxidoreductase [Segeticoccus sp.]|nr:Gfo/Idh/MocA family oxidoreductase [Segeticoccus sp.]
MDTTPAPDRLAGRPVRWGFLGAGDIARVMADTVAATPGHELVAVAARDGARAEAFAEEFGADRSHAGYDALLADEAVDAVYLNTTHTVHHPQLLAAVAAGKPVLCEKPLTLNADQAHEALAAARRHGVLVMEAMWMRCQPLVRRAAELVASGRIGRVVSVQARLGTRFAYDPAHRLFDPANGGGALLDLGVYPASFAWLFLGEPDTVQVTGCLAPTGVDATVSLQWGYARGASAQLFCSSQGEALPSATVVGTAGTIDVAPSFQDPTELLLSTDDGEERFSGERHGFRPELEEFERCLRTGVVESELVPHAHTVGVLQVLDATRVELGVKYPQESAIGQL